MISKTKTKNHNFKDITGRWFARLIVVEFAGVKTFPSGQKRALWLCQCHCGKQITALGSDLRSGHTRSCGCYQKETAQETGKNHRTSTRKVEERFWEKVDRSGGSNACWPWLAKAKHKFGYGYFNADTSSGEHRTKIKSAHRMAWELTYGPIEDAQNVLHRCDNPPCCNPAHLFLGTQLDNMKDASRKHRMPAGTNHWTAKRHHSNQAK